MRSQGSRSQNGTILSLKVSTEDSNFSPWPKMNRGLLREYMCSLPMGTKMFSSLHPHVAELGPTGEPSQLHTHRCLSVLPGAPVGVRAQALCPPSRTHDLLCVHFIRSASVSRASVEVRQLRARLSWLSLCVTSVGHSSRLFVLL